MTSFTPTWLKDVPKCKPLLLSIPLFSLALPLSANSLFIFSEECDLLKAAALTLLRRYSFASRYRLSP
jgi:hypothetical protein